MSTNPKFKSNPRVSFSPYTLALLESILDKMDFILELLKPIQETGEDKEKPHVAP